MQLKKKTIMVLALSLSIFSQGMIVHAKEDGARIRPEGSGKWMTGEYHSHTYQSDDASQSLQELLDNGFQKYGLDWIAVSDHLRVSKRDDEGNPLAGGSIPFSMGMAQYQIPKIQQLQEAGKYKNKIIFSGFEWDMPTYEHVGIGIISGKFGSESSLKAARQFEYLFTDRDEAMFNPKDVADWNKQNSRAYTTPEDARAALIT